MANDFKVKKAINKKFPAINSDNNLQEAVDLMTRNGVSVLVVTVGEQVIGLVTVTDVIHAIANDYDLANTKVSMFMTECQIDGSHAASKICAQLDEDMDVVSAIKVMYEGGINHLLVTGENNQPTGVVSNFDLIKLLAAK